MSYTYSGRRCLTPFMQRLRDLLNWRKSVEHNRYKNELTTPDRPMPNLPGGPSHVLADNYYCGRDGRREKGPPLVMTNQSQRLLSSGAGPVVVAAQRFSKPPTPGPVYDPPIVWDAEGYLVVGDRDEIWEDYNNSRKFNKPGTKSEIPRTGP